jgi:hypothetical protein
MKQNTDSLIKWLVLAFYAFIAFFYIKIAIHPELYYHFQQPPFIADIKFFSSFLPFPGGISQYLSDFISQFFYFEWIGSLVMLFTGLLMLFSGLSIFNSYKAHNFSYFWMFIPFILFISVINNYFLPFVVVIKILMIFLVTLLYRFLNKKKMNSFILFIILVPLIYYIAGSGPLMIFSATILISEIIDSDKIKNSILFLIFGIIYTYLFALISYKYIFTISTDEAYFSFLPNLPEFLKYRPEIHYKLFCVSLPLITLLILIYQKFIHRFIKNAIDYFKNGQPSLKIISYAFAGVIISVLSYFTVKSSIDVHKKNIVMADYYCYNEQWDKVIKIALSDHQYDIFINLYYNRAIDNSGGYLDQFFNYPQLMGTDALFPDKISAPELSEICSDYYFDLGYISEAQHWAYEALTVFPYSIRLLKRLVITNLIYKNYQGAGEYLSILDKNFLARDFVKKYKPYVADTMLVLKDNFLTEKRLSMPGAFHLSSVISNRFFDLINKNANNRRAYEHLQISSMLDLNLGQFIQNLPEAGKFYNKLPELYEQAILMYIYLTKKGDINQYKISAKSGKTFIGYLKTMREYDNNKEFAKPDLGDYSGTYMYYVTYNSPLVTHAVITNKNEQKY